MSLRFQEESVSLQEMSPFFQKLPRELRDQIYRELLYDEFWCLRPQGPHREDVHEAKKLHLNILRTCKLAYAESSRVLYEENLFSWDYRLACVEKGGQNLYRKEKPPKGAFQRIKKLKILSRPNSKGQQHACPDAEELMTIVNYITNLGCSLTSVFLQIDFDGAEVADCGNQREAARRIARSMTLRKGIADLDVKTKITISIASDHLLDRQRFDDFAFVIGFMKDWTVILKTDLINSHLCYDDGEEDGDQEEISGDSGEELPVELDPQEANEDEEEEQTIELDCQEANKDEEDSEEDTWDHLYDDSETESLDNERKPGRHIWTWTLTDNLET